MSPDSAGFWLPLREMKKLRLFALVYPSSTILNSVHPVLLLTVRRHTVTQVSAGREVSQPPSSNSQPIWALPTAV